MAVNGVNQGHPAHLQNAHAPAARGPQSGTSKVSTTNSHATEGAAQGRATTPAATAENNAGREQAKRKNTGENAGGETGKHLNVYA